MRYKILDQNGLNFLTMTVVDWQKIKDVHLNPVKEGVVLKMEEYVYSSAKNYAEEKGLLEVELMDFYDEVG